MTTIYNILGTIFCLMSIINYLVYDIDGMDSLTVGLIFLVLSKLEERE